MLRSRTWMIVVALAATAGCGKKSGEKKEAAASTAPATGAPAPNPEPAAAAPAGPGVEAGGIARSADEGPAAVLTGIDGTVEVRRVGEIELRPATADTELHVGDVVRTGESSSATITLADETVIEVAEVSTVAIGSRDGTADPASSGAVLAGLARFTVSPRAPGEGPFRVYTTAGMVVTRGTVYAVGVAASGEARVGVESGAVEVIGLADVTAAPVSVEAGHTASLAASGTVAAPAAWAADDWGTWRAESDAEVTATAAIDAHAAALADLEAKLATAYADLEASAAAAAAFEAEAATAAETNAAPAYEAAAPAGAATIEASFALAGYIEALTWAHGSRATLATEVYTRHPDEVTVAWQAAAPRVDAAFLWPKRFEVTAAAYLTPLRAHYYVHHPRGRAHAAAVGVAVPEFYASAKVPEPEPAAVRARVKTRVYLPPVMTAKAEGRAVWTGAPPPGWRAKVKVKPAPVRARVGWYVRPPDARASVLVGMPVKAKFTSKLKVGAPRLRGELTAGFKTKLGTRAHVRPAAVAAPRPPTAATPRPPTAAETQARMEAAAAVKGDIRAPAVPDVRVKMDRADRVKTDVGGAADAKVKAGVKAGAGLKAGAGAGAGAAGGAGAGAGADVKVKLKVPPPPPPPKVEVKGKIEAKGKLKIGG